MKKFLFITLLSFSFLLCGCLDSKPKCNDENVLLTLRQILDEQDEWAYVEYGLTKQSLKDLAIIFNGLDLRTALAMADTDISGLFVTKKNTKAYI